jgi:hypothetical protein
MNVSMEWAMVTKAVPFVICAPQEHALDECSKLAANKPLLN